MEEDNSPLVKILLGFFVISTLIIGGIYLFTLNKSIQIGSLIPSFASGHKPKDYGYNFELPSGSIDIEARPVREDSTYAANGEKDEILTREQKQLAFNYEIEEGQIGTIVIPAIGVNSPVYRGSNGEKLLDQGFWHYPSTHLPGKGEAILLCHRRYFNSHDPRSCWNLDRVGREDIIQLNDNEGKPISFSVKSVTVKAGDDLNIYRLSNENYLKIVSCSLENGKIGGSTHRVVVIAEKI